MGVIFKLLYRGEVLNEPRHRRLFLDMEENIHIHLRDLRIELSRREFEDIARTFAVQSEELLKIIQERDYQDGVLPNSNLDSVTIWTDSQLHAPVAYHPHRISLEECTDGFHLHLRNYKILLNREEFETLAEVFRSIDLAGAHASTVPDILTLLDVNHVHYFVKKGAGQQKGENERHIVVTKYHSPKVQSIFSEIGMERHSEGATLRYTKGDVVFRVSVSKNKDLFAGRMGMSEQAMMPLVEYLSQDEEIDPNRLNDLKAKVLDTFLMVEKAGNQANINLDFGSWIYDLAKSDVVFPFAVNEKPLDTKRLYLAWSEFLKSRDMYFVKPTKAVSEKKRQKELHDTVMEKIADEVETVPAVSKVYLMGSALRGDMGLYPSPFIHSRWATLGSDIDLLIEVDDVEAAELPKHWQYINVSSNRCDIYHVGQIEASDEYRLTKRYPNIEFFHHLLDAYVYMPSRGDKKTKDEFLKKHKAELIYDREAGVGQNKIQLALKEAFGPDVKALEKFDVATENDLYSVEVDGRPSILKVYKVSGNYPSKKLIDHARYEADVVNEVVDRGFETAAIAPTRAGDSVFLIGDYAAILFDKLVGEVGGEPDYPVNQAAKALAHFHKVQIDAPIALETEFTFDQVFEMWKKEFHRFAQEVRSDKELSEWFVRLEGIYNRLNATYDAIVSNKKLTWLHNHGDVTPRNVILDGGNTYLFDFQNTFHGPRLFDVVDGGVEFSWGTKDAKLNDFGRFGQFVEAYMKAAKLSAVEKSSLDKVVEVVGLIKFVKEVRMIKGSKNKHNLRRMRALDLARFLGDRLLKN